LISYPEDKTDWWRANNQNAPRVGSSLKKLLGCGVSAWYTLFVGWIEYSIKHTQHYFS